VIQPFAAGSFPEEEGQPRKKGTGGEPKDQTLVFSFGVKARSQEMKSREG
jgi:hypothetical protein